MDVNQIVYYVGLALLALGAVGGVAVLLLFHKAGKSLHKQLENEYGKPRHS